MASPSLVAIQPRGSEAPLFCFHAGMGTLMFYYDLSRLLGPSQPVYGLSPRGLNDDSIPHRTVEEMVADYVQEIRTVQPRGPYHLVGFCFGGLLAFEAARQLASAAERVPFLAILDGGFDYSRADVNPVWIRRQLGEIRRRRAADTARVLWKKVSGRIRRAGRGARDRAAFAIGDAFRGIRRPLPKPLRSVYVRKNHDRMERSFVARSYSGRLLLFVSQGIFRDPRLGWERVVQGEIDLSEVPFDPSDYYRNFWTALSDRLDRERGRPPRSAAWREAAAAGRRAPGGGTRPVPSDSPAF